MRPLVALLFLFAGAPAAAQPRMPAVRPLWTFDVHDAPDLVTFDAAHAIIVEDENLTRVRLSDGAVVTTATLPDCSSLYPAASGRWFLLYDPISSAGAHGLLVSCVGGTGLAPVHFAAMIDPATLAVRWRIDGGATHLDPTAELDGLVPIETAAYRTPIRVLGVDAATGAVRWTSEPLGPNDQCTDIFQDTTGVYHLDCRGRIVALDRATGAIRWRLSTVALRLARLVPGRLFVAGQHQLRALDTATGREVWRFDAPGTTPIAEIAPLDDTTLAVQLHAGELLALAAADGAVRWRAPTGGVHGLAVHGDHVAVSGATSVVAVERRTGHGAASLSLTEASALTWAGDALAGVERTEAATERPADGRLFRLDPTTGASWRGIRPAFGDAPIHAVGPLLVACSDDGVVHALDAATGAGRWRAFVGAPPSPRAGPCELYPSEPDGVVLALGAGHRLSAFSAAPAARPNRRSTARVVVSGKVFTPGSPAGIRVRVGDVWTRTAADGTFAVALRGSGTVTARVHPADALRRCAYAETVTVPLRGAPHVRLHVEPDHCACHPCD